jgi:ABC-2 type transport system ATP-binding protein
MSVAEHPAARGVVEPARWDAAIGTSAGSTSSVSTRRSALGTLSGGQRAQLALTLAVSKRPELLVLDEPVASLDPLARREFLRGLADVVSGNEVSVVLSSHLVADLERVCDYLIVLVASRVQVAGTIDELLASHHRLTGPPGASPGASPGAPDGPAGHYEIIEADAGDHQSTLVVRGDDPVVDPVVDPAWSVEPVSLEDVVLAYMGRAAGGARPRISSSEPRS